MLIGSLLNPQPWSVTWSKFDLWVSSCRGKACQGGDIQRAGKDERRKPLLNRMKICIFLVKLI